MPAFLERLTAGQRQVLLGLASLVVLLGLAVGVVALGSDDGPPQAVRTEGAPDDGGTTSTQPRSTTSGPTSTSSSVASGGAGADDGRIVDPPATATTRRGQAAVTTTTPRSGGGAGGPTTTKGPLVTAPPSAMVGCTTAGSGGAAADLASRYCQRRGANGATAGMERSARLDAAAREWAQELAARGELDHGGYREPVREVCPSCRAGENVARHDPPSPGGAWEEWLASPPHKAAIDDPRGGYYGTGAALSADGRWEYYVQVFAWR